MSAPVLVKDFQREIENIEPEYFELVQHKKKVKGSFFSVRVQGKDNISVTCSKVSAKKLHVIFEAFDQFQKENLYEVVFDGVKITSEFDGPMFRFVEGLVKLEKFGCSNLTVPKFKEAMKHEFWIKVAQALASSDRIQEIYLNGLKNVPWDLVANLVKERHQYAIIDLSFCDFKGDYNISPLGQALAKASRISRLSFAYCNLEKHMLTQLLPDEEVMIHDIELAGNKLKEVVWLKHILNQSKVEVLGLSSMKELQPQEVEQLLLRVCQEMDCPTAIKVDSQIKKGSMIQTYQQKIENKRKVYLNSHETQIKQAQYEVEAAEKLLEEKRESLKLLETQVV